MDSFSDTCKAVILVTFCIVLCLQNKTFIDRVQKYLDPAIAGCLPAIFLFHHLPDLFFWHNVTFYSIKKCQVHFMTLFSIFKYRIFMFFLFSMYLHPVLHKNNSFGGGNFLPGHVNRHLKQLIYKTNIFNILHDLKFLTIFNISNYYDFSFSPSFNFNATYDDNLVIPECILTL